MHAVRDEIAYACFLAQRRVCEFIYADRCFLAQRHKVMYAVLECLRTCLCELSNFTFQVHIGVCM